MTAAQAQAAPDRDNAMRGGYAAQTVPLILGTLPFRNIHDELVEQMLRLEARIGDMIRVR